jgi:hypothetical protein
MLIDLSFAASRCSTFSGLTIKAAMLALPADRRPALAVGSTLTAFPASSQYTPAERSGLFLRAEERHSDHD